MRANTAILLVILVAAIGWLIYDQLNKNSVYFLTPTELLAKGDAAVGESYRLGGMVQTGSIRWNNNQSMVYFELTDGKRTVSVQSTRVPPEMFKEGMGVIVEGELSARNRFETDKIMIRHSNEYRPPEIGYKPRYIYEDLRE